MIDYGRVRSTVHPEPIVVDDFSVWVNTDVREITEAMPMMGEDQVFHGYEYHMIQYGKDEYIRMMAEQTAQNNQLMNAILGVTE